MGCIKRTLRFRVAKIRSIQISKMVAMADILKILSLNLMGGIGVLWRFRIAELVQLHIQDGGHDGNSSNNIRF